MIESDLRKQVADAVAAGSSEASLGIVKMPKGYALLLNPDRSHYYFMRHDGVESCIHWNRWSVYKWAMQDFEVFCKAAEPA